VTRSSRILQAKRHRVDAHQASFAPHRRSAQRHPTPKSANHSPASPKIPSPEQPLISHLALVLFCSALLRVCHCWSIKLSLPFPHTLTTPHNSPPSHYCQSVSPRLSFSRFRQPPPSNLPSFSRPQVPVVTRSSAPATLFLRPVVAFLRLFCSTSFELQIFNPRETATELSPLILDHNPRACYSRPLDPVREHLSTSRDAYDLRSKTW
jgi:hypothetical protein